MNYPENIIGKIIGWIEHPSVYTGKVTSIKGDFLYFEKVTFFDITTFKNDTLNNFYAKPISFAIKK